MVKSTKAAAREQEKAEAREQLLKILKPGDTVHCVLRNVAASGMSRLIDFYVIQDGDMRYLSGYIAKLLDYKRHPTKQGLRVSGCGMDMGFAVVYELGHALWPNGFDLPKGERGRNGDTSGHDNDGGYALKHNWL